MIPAWRATYPVVKEAREVVRIREPRVVGNFGNVQSTLQQQLTCMIQAEVDEIVLKRQAGDLLEDAREVRGTEAYLPGNLIATHRTREARVQHCLGMTHRLGVYLGRLLARHRLAQPCCEQQKHEAALSYVMRISVDRVAQDDLLG